MMKNYDNRRVWANVSVNVILIWFIVLLAGGCSETLIEVNGEKVKKSIYDQEMMRRQVIHEGKHTPMNGVILEETAVQAIVKRVVLLQEARRRGIAVTQGELYERWRSYTSRFKNEQTLKEYLKKMDMCERDLRMRIWETLLIEKLYADIRDGIMIAEDEAKQYYYEKNWDSVGPMNMQIAYVKTASKKQADEIAAEMKRRASFMRVFLKLRENGKQGVDVVGPSWMRQEETGPDLYREAQRILTKRYRGPFNINDAWYIIMVYERKPGFRGYEEARDTLLQTMREQRANAVLKQLLDDALASATIKIYKDKL